MMTIPSIDMTMTSDLSVGEFVSQPMAASAPYDRPAVSMPLAQPMPAFGGMGELVSDNAALGEALQVLVDGMDNPPAAMRPANETPSSRPAVESSVPLRSEGDFVSADEVAPIPAPPRGVVGQVEKAPVFLRSEGDFASADEVAPIPAPPRGVVGQVEKAPVSLRSEGDFASADEVAPIPAPPRGVVGQVEKAPVSLRSEGDFASADEVAPIPALPRGVVGRVEKAPVSLRSEGELASETIWKFSIETSDNADSEPSGSVVLQAAPVAAMPIVDGAVPTSETTVEAVTVVSRIEATDLSTLFLAAADAVAAAVTVSPELMRGEAGEIRVQLRPDVLEGAEVVVAVDGRKMDVTFVPTVTHVADTLASNQSLMQKQLAARIAGFEISVGVVQAVATNVAVNVGSERASQMAVNRARKTYGRA